MFLFCVCVFFHRLRVLCTCTLLPYEFVSCKVAIPPFLSLPETTVLGVLLLPVQRLSLLPLRWAASLWASLCSLSPLMSIGPRSSWVVFSRAPKSLACHCFLNDSAKLQLFFYICKFLCKKNHFLLIFFRKCRFFAFFLRFFLCVPKKSSTFAASKEIGLMKNSFF